jgi:rhizosphere induced protein
MASSSSKEAQISAVTPAQGDGVRYTLMFQNNSTNAWNACVYQTQPDISNYEVQSLAWFSKAAAPTTHVRFDWTVNYSFVWDETGPLAPGVVFDASQTWPADLSTTNRVTLTHPNSPYSYYTFEDQGEGANGGSLYILTDETVPLNMASVGIGMSGSGTFVCQAQPNLHLIFTPHPTYWITFGLFEQGQVLDLTEITNSAAIAFPAGIYTMYAILNQDNTWTVTAKTPKYT